MGKKRKNHPSVEDVLARPWCYYCERDFDDLKILINHQKAKHFKCDRCGRRLNTAGGLAVHMNQVHKEQLTSVENALPNRQGLEVEIFGMEGIPDDVMQTHNQRVLQQYYEEAAERRAKSGNALPGEAPARKKLKVETADELKARFEKWRRKKLAGELPAQDTPPQASAPAPMPAQPVPVAAPGFPQQLPPGAAPLQGYPPPSVAFAAPGISSLPPRPGFSPPGAFPGMAPPPGVSATESSIDDLIASVTGQGGMSAAPAPAAPEEAPVASGKKGKSSKMVWSDNEISPEERMAQLPRYAVTAG